jgi:tetratricopeptide (TPR) repeat protein
MSRFIIVLLFALAQSAILRAQDDAWVGQWVFPRVKDTPLLDRDDEELMKWAATAGKVTWAGKDWITIRHEQYPGPYEGFVRKSEVVMLFDALPYFTNKIKADKRDAWSLSRRGEAWVLKDIQGLAIKDFDEAIRLDPTAAAYIQRGITLYTCAEYDRAMKDFDEAIRLDPMNAWAFNSRGRVWYAQEEYDKAIKDYGEAIQLDPRYVQAFYNRSKVWLSKSPNDKSSARVDFTKALKDCDEIISLDPTNPEIFIYRGDLLRNSQGAISDYTEAIRLNPNHTVAYYKRGLIQKERASVSEALKDFTQAVRCDPKFTDALIQRSLIWTDRKEYDKAIEDTTAAIEADANSAHAYYIRGNAWLLKKEYDKATGDFTASIRREPNNIDSLCARGHSRNGKKDFDKAIEDFDSALRLYDIKMIQVERLLSPNEETIKISMFNDVDYLRDRKAFALSGRAMAWNNKGEYGRAKNDYNNALGINGNKSVDSQLQFMHIQQNPSLANNVAWFLATCPDAKYRDGKRAVDLAEKASKFPRVDASTNLDVLAAALAETGDFPAAIQREKQAIEKTTDATTLEQRRARLKLFEEKKPYHEPEKKE